MGFNIVKPFRNFFSGLIRVEPVTTGQHSYNCHKSKFSTTVSNYHINKWVSIFCVNLNVLAIL